MSIQLSAFADEISQDLDEQIAVLKKNGVGAIELRGVWGKNVMALSDAEVQRVAATARDNGIGFSAIGSPIGKFPLDGDFNEELERLKRAIELAQTLSCKYIRMFSYYVPQGKTHAECRAQCIDWVGRLAQAAEPSGIKCALENEKGIYADTGDRFLDVFQSINSPALVGVFDPANYVQCGQRPYQDCWLKIKPFIEYFHIKDARMASGSIVVAGSGDGDITMILSEAFNEGYDNFLTLEPHLKVAGHSHGETGPELFKTAVEGLRKVLRDIGAL
ncbi:MAG: sugar phosphate isomerase/epimerase [Candidatus Sumerlaeota bacterium]|nr:sugar phosphate isomerase/epimerase [Candidatus Sumerlaeota bacterium]